MRHYSRNVLLIGVLELGARKGVSQKKVLSHLKLDAEEALRPGGMVPSDTIVDAIEFIARESGNGNFGLEFGLSADDNILAAIAVFLGHCKTIEQAISEASRYTHLLNSALAFKMKADGDKRFLFFEVDHLGKHEPQHYCEAVLVITVRFCKFVLGSAWKPQRVLLGHTKSASAAMYQHAFGCPVKLNAGMNAIEMTADDFSRRIDLKSAPIQTLVETALESVDASAPAGEETLPDKIAAILPPLLASGQASAANVAGLLNMSPRSLQRQLARQGKSFRSVIEAVRMKIIEDQLATEGASGQKLATLLGFSQPSAVSRFMSTHMGKPSATKRAEKDNA